MSDAVRPTYLLRPLSRAIGIAALLFILFFGVFGVWASLAPLQSAAVAPGYIGVESKRKTIQHLDGGSVAEIRVRDGDYVEAGQLLLRLDDAIAAATLELLDGQYTDLLAEESRLRAEHGRRPEIDFPPYLLERVDEKGEGGGRAAQAIETQRGVFEARRRAMESKQRILAARIQETEQQIEGFRIQREAMEKRLVLIESERSDLQKIVSQGLEAKPRLRAFEREKVEIEGQIGEITSRIAQARLRIGETRLEVLDLESELLNRVAGDLRRIRGKVLDMEPRLQTARDALERTALRAPESGTVVGLRYHTIGGVIPPGGAILDIVPDQSEYIVEARISPRDIDVVRPGLATEVRLTAFSARNTPTVMGQLIRVSADRMVSEKSGQPYYAAQVRLELKEGGAIEPRRLYPGMPVEVMVVTGTRTTLDYLLSPINDILSRAFREQ